MYLSTKLEVDHNYGYLRTGNDENTENEEQEAEEVIKLILPESSQDEK